MRALDPAAPQRILVRGTNWVGDAVMTLPALEALARACPQARIEVLAKPWAAAVYAACPAVDGVRVFEDPGRHEGLGGLRALAREIKASRYDWALLLQNALQAGLLAWLARVPTRLGYSTDGRGLLLTHALKRPQAARKVHETSYYLHILHLAGLLAEAPPFQGVVPVLKLAQEDVAWVGDFLAGQGLSDAPLLGLAPGAAFGPAKRWPAERFAAVAKELMDSGFEAVLLFGAGKEAGACQETAAGLNGLTVVDLAGQTSLGQALALLARLKLFITNDSGLMHAAAALGTPTLAVFGSTNPVTTGPLGPWVSLVRKPVDCSPCLKPECPRDLRCFTAIEPGEVAAAGRELLARRAGEG